MEMAGLYSLPWYRNLDQDSLQVTHKLSSTHSSFAQAFRKTNQQDC